MANMLKEILTNTFSFMSILIPDGLINFPLVQNKNKKKIQFHYIILR